MSVAVLDRTLNLAPRKADAAKAAVVERSPRTRTLLHGPIVPTLLLMAWPNVLVMFAQAATGLIETWFVAKLGTDALAGMALVFPAVMLVQMISAGAMGGGISSAIARALGAGRRDEANSLVIHALVITVVLGASFSVLMLAFGRPTYRALGGEDSELDAAVTYSNVVFAGNVLLWVCAVTRRRFPVGASPTRRPLQPEATGAVMEATKWLKPTVSVSRNTMTARVCRP